MLTARLKAKGKLSGFKWEIHPLFSSIPQSTGGIALNANPTLFAQALPLSVNLIETSDHLAQLRADRFLISRELDFFKITLGRQAITLGQGRAFTRNAEVTSPKNYRNTYHSQRKNGVGSSTKASTTNGAKIPRGTNQ